MAEDKPNEDLAVKVSNAAFDEIYQKFGYIQKMIEAGKWLSLPGEDKLVELEALNNNIKGSLECLYRNFKYLTLLDWSKENMEPEFIEKQKDVLRGVGCWASSVGHNMKVVESIWKQIYERKLNG